ncbi:hypothetical protein Plec18167_008439 [Paecilomyces lecythidis]|uniref:Zn(2)-C6 fungal-type domain-containing protein n=1 Tax=Paecilomyces lecythidis TaxID=3004212 RepID=A0ABR3WWU3_9EURO
MRSAGGYRRLVYQNGEYSIYSAYNADLPYQAAPGWRALCAMSPDEGEDLALFGCCLKVNKCPQVKCNASQRFPAPCSGCAKAGERCSVDPSFKRTPKRSLKPRHGHGHEEDEPSYRTPQSEGSGPEPTDPSSTPGEPLPGSDSSLTSVTAELRLGWKGSARFIHEATGVSFTSGVVAELLEEYEKSSGIFVFSLLTTI